MPAARLLLVLFALGSGALVARASGWAHLQVGMSAAQTIRLLGDPILRSSGHGFERWSYDDGAEVLIYADGSVVGWTAPGSSHGNGRSTDIWSRQPAHRRYGTMHAVLPRLETRPKAAAGPAAPHEGTYESYLRT